MARGVGREKVRELLGLAVWEVELAVETGLLRRLPNRTFDPVSVNAAQADPEHFRQLLAAEHRCNATQAAARLGISAELFKQLATGLAPVAVEEIRKYGRALVTRFYRAADVDALADHARADAELRAAARAYSRSEAARKAARTRKLNVARAQAARAEIEAAKPAPDRDRVDVLIWAAALMTAASVWPGALRRLRLIVDPRVPPLVTALRQARLTPAELEALLTALPARATELIALLIPPQEAERKLGVPINLIPDELQRFGDHLFVPLLDELLAAPPSWLLRARADQELREAALAEARRAVAAASRCHGAEQAAVDAATRAASRLSDTSVAELFGLPDEVIRLLVPRAAVGRPRTSSDCCVTPRSGCSRRPQPERKPAAVAAGRSFSTCPSNRSPRESDVPPAERSMPSGGSHQPGLADHHPIEEDPLPHSQFAAHSGRSPASLNRLIRLGLP